MKIEKRRHSGLVLCTAGLFCVFSHRVNEKIYFYYADRYCRGDGFSRFAARGMIAERAVLAMLAVALFYVGCKSRGKGDGTVLNVLKVALCTIIILSVNPLVLRMVHLSGNYGKSVYPTSADEHWHYTPFWVNFYLNYVLLYWDQIVASKPVRTLRAVIGMWSPAEALDRVD